jgi:hypothetical protein
MPYLIRQAARPLLENLPEADRYALEGKFDPQAYDLIINGRTLPWQNIEEVEVAKAARQNTPAGWFVRHIVYTEDRYHVGIYFGSDEEVLPNLKLHLAQFVVQSIAHYLQKPIKYTGVEGLSPVSDEP